MNCDKCLNGTNCEESHIMNHVRACPKCHKQAAEYRFNKVGNLVFYICACCGYTAEDYAKDLREGK